MIHELIDIIRAQDPEAAEAVAQAMRELDGQ